MNHSRAKSGSWAKGWWVALALSWPVHAPLPVLAQTTAPTPAPQNPAPAPPNAVPAPAQKPNDGVENAQFGELMELVVRPAITMTGKANWDDIYPELRLVFEKLNKIAKDNGLTVSGPPLVLFANPDADMAEYSAMLPVAALSAGMEEKLKPALPGQTPGGKVLRFVHLGAYDTIGQTYDEAANLLDERHIKIEEATVEEYIRDPETTREADLATFIYVFPKP